MYLSSGRIFYKWVMRCTPRTFSKVRGTQVEAHTDNNDACSCDKNSVDGVGNTEMGKYDRPNTQNNDYHFSRHSDIVAQGA